VSETPRTSETPKIARLLRIDELCDLFADVRRAGRKMTPDEFLVLIGQVPSEADPELRQELGNVVAEACRGRSEAAACGDADSDGGDGSATPAEPNDRRVLPPGYQMLGTLGRGGMGVVYKVQQLNPKRVVALKMVSAGVSALPDELARFRAEAQAIARVVHKNVVQVYEVGEHSGLPFFSLEYCPGKTLKETLNDGPLSPTDAASLVQQLARGVEAIHQANLVHRDLKPANILRDADGTPKVADFGLARLGDAGNGLTHSGQVMGTPSYMAPEQARGGSREVGRAADVYALGAILYECLTGRPPFREATALATLKKVETEEPLSVRRLVGGVSRDLEAICRKCLEKNTSQRYESAAALADDLQNYLEGKPTVARPPGAVLQLVRLVVRHRVLIAGVLASFGLLLGSGYAIWKTSREQHRDTITTQLTAALDAKSLPDEECERIEVWLRELEHLDRNLADSKREKYILKLIELSGSGAKRSERSNRLERLERAVAQFTARGEDGVQLLRKGETAGHFRALAPNSHSTKLDAFIRPDPDRVSNLERVVRLTYVFTDKPEKDRYGVRPTLLRAYLVANRLSDAWELATAILRDPDIPAAWRLLVYLDLTWTALSSGKQTWQTEAGNLIEKQLNSEVPEDRGRYTDLLVEQAHLLNAAGKRAEARQRLELYFRAVEKREVVLNFPADHVRDDARFHDGGPSDVNVAVLFYLDAVLLKGLLELDGDLSNPKPELWKKAQQEWAKGYANVRGQGTGDYYEAALLGSLSEKIQESEAEKMLSDALNKSESRSPVLASVQQRLSDPKLKEVAPRLLAALLREAWLSKPGWESARRIITREMGYSEFVHAQVRVWLYELFRTATGGPNRLLLAAVFVPPARVPNSQFASEEDELIWSLVTQLHEAFAAEAFSEDEFVALLAFGVDRGWQSSEGWEPLAAKFPVKVQSSLAYVFGRSYLNFPSSRDRTPDYYRYARERPGYASLPVSIRTQIEMELRKP
jgi:serine/threonine protein kinase